MTTLTRPAPPTIRPGREHALREIGVFLGVTVVLTGLTTGVALAEGVDVRRIGDASALGQAAMYLQALVPLVAALAARSVTHGSLRRPGWGFRRTSWRNVAKGWGYGLATTVAGGAAVWATGSGGFRTSGLGPSVALGLTVLVLPYVVLALAEDVGWRGLLVTRLAQIAGPRSVVLVGGLAWSAFHWPMIALLGGTPEGVSVWFALAAFTVATTSFGAVLASMQLRWGIWPGVVAHAVVNATLYHVLEPLTVEHAHTTWFSTETGLFAACSALIGGWLWWRRYPLAVLADGRTGVPAAPLAMATAAGQRS
jgi:membrane protease YdiL (CAAX protease family)